MAYMSQEKKKKIQDALKSTVPFGWKWSLRVRHHSTIVMTIKKGPKALMEYAPLRAWAEDYEKENYARRIKEDHRTLNIYHLDKEFPEGSTMLEPIKKILACLNTDNFDRSDIQSDYFCVGHHVDLNIGSYDKPFEAID